MKSSQFAAKLQRLRIERGENLAQTAIRAGIYRSQLTRLETGRTQSHQVAIGVALALIEAFKPRLKLKDFVR